ncbi:MAG: energy transducer TonB [Vicinamibacteria bacterium]
MATVGLLSMAAIAIQGGDLLARLRDSNEAERVAALVELGKVSTPELSMLDPIAGRLLDEAASVQLAAAYSLAGVAGKLGCSLKTLAACKLFASVLDATPKKIKNVHPVYPLAAKEAHVQGAVMLEYVVRSDGAVDRVRVVSGPELLRDAAMTSIKEWKYQPATREGKPVPFAMLTTLNFTLSF